MPPLPVSPPPANALTNDQKAAGPIMATMAVADHAAASTHGIAISTGSQPWPAAPGDLSPTVPPSAQCTLRTGYGSASRNAAYPYQVAGRVDAGVAGRARARRASTTT